MTQINWGLANGGNFQNALATGLQFGQMAAQAKQQRETKNALAAYGQSPNEETLGGVMQADPRLGIQLRGDMQAQQAKAAEAGLTQRALAGDTAALDELATVNFNKWKALSAETKAAAASEAKLFGNAAIDILGTPEAQRAAKLQGYAQQFGQQYPEIAQIAQLPPEQLDAALRGAVAEAGMVEKLIAMEQPKYMAIPEGGTLVDTRNPQAVSSFASNQSQPGPSIPPEAAEALRRGEGTPEQFDQMFGPGSAARVMGGPAGNGGGTFPPNQ